MKELLRNIKRQDMRNALAIIIVIGCFVQMLVMQFHAIPDNNKDLMNMVIGFVFGGSFAGVIGYYFGSSKSDENKNDK